MARIRGPVVRRFGGVTARDGGGIVVPITAAAAAAAADGQRNRETDTRGTVSVKGTATTSIRLTDRA